MTPIEQAHEYAEWGWRVVPLPAGQKGPNTKGWQMRLCQPSEIAPGGNIGVQLGPCSGDLVDIDLDCPEALVLADIYLPPTGAIFGRSSRRRSHWLYVSAGAIFEEFVDPLIKKKKTILELRAQGREGGAHQTLMPPSVADDERREWEHDTIKPATFDAAKLRRRCAYLAIACLIRRYVSEQTSERPTPDLPHLLFAAEPILGREAYRWLGMPDPDAPKCDLRHAATTPVPK
jgi:Bifunctional DNA primase/polymerase, N-terminal